MTYNKQFVLGIMATIFFSLFAFFGAISQLESSKATEQLVYNVYKGQEALDYIIKGMTATPEYIEDLQGRIDRLGEETLENRELYHTYKKRSSFLYAGSLVFFILGMSFSIWSLSYSFKKKH